MEIENKIKVRKFNNSKNILTFTVGDYNLASSRLRSFKLFNNFFDYKIHRKFSFKSFYISKFIHVQKQANYKIILLVIFAKLLNKKILFDFDDQYFSKSEKFYRILFFLISNKIIVDTKSRLEFTIQAYPFLKKKTIVIPDMLDFDIEIVKNDISYQNCQNKTFLWYGYAENIVSIKFVFEYVKKIHSTITIISSSKDTIINIIGEELWNDSYCTFIKWEQDILNKLNPQKYLVILNHDFEEFATLKSENKLVLALAYGFPVIASNTQAYNDFANKISAKNIIYNTKSNFENFIISLGNANIEIQKEKLLNVLNSHFSKNNIQSNFKHVLENI